MRCYSEALVDNFVAVVCDEGISFTIDRMERKEFHGYMGPCEDSKANSRSLEVSAIIAVKTVTREYSKITQTCMSGSQHKSKCAFDERTRL